MSVLVDERTRVVVQGITGRDGSFHAKKMKEYGTKVVAGVTPGKGGTFVDGIPVFNSVIEAVEKEGANTSCIFVPAKFALDAIFEAGDSGVSLIVTITEGIPVIDMVKGVRYLEERGVRLIGPNCPGIISPGKSKVGIIPERFYKKGRVGIVSRSGTLTYEIASHITEAGYGESTAVGIGGDPVIGTKFVDMLELFRDDPETEAVVIIGEIGGSDEEDAARYIVETKFQKPVLGIIAGRTAPPGKKMGHAGAIITGGTGTAEEKIRAFKDAGVLVADIPEDVVKLLKEVLKG
uniref:Succinate--CoA ligase [ADP-forming] subunit alpha n=1 Tax=candidate division WOR-3 bacterium TaxID=2052148 RepID=A0A7C4U8X7_UNCW3